MDRFEDAKLRIKEATDLVALIESYLPLKPRGSGRLVALCPFHAENSPSFYVNRDGQFYKCFGCGKSGDVFTWLMERDGLTFREAMEVLAERANISLEGVFQRGAERGPAGPDPYQNLDAVAGLFQRALLASTGPVGEGAQLARDYLERRGLSEAIEPWRLGYHPPAGTLLRFAQAQGLSLEVLEQAGLLRNGRESFAGRVMFPIEDERGRVVGFGGRLIPGAPGSEGEGDYKPPKYLNSPESPFFNKRRVLFGLHKVKQAGQRRIVVMEGYTDVIACHLAGFRGAVASLGTAFTAEHARTVERYASDGLVLMFDGDRAGVQAAERALRELVNSRLEVRIAMMGDAEGGTAKDPADVVTARPGEDPELVAARRERFADVITGAENALAVWFRILRKRLDLNQAVHLETAAQMCGALLEQVESPVRRAALLQQMARHLNVPAPAFERLLEKSKRPAARDGAPAKGTTQNPPVAPAQPRTPMQQAEFDLLACVLASPNLLANFDPAAEAPLLSNAVSTLLAWAADGAVLGRTGTGEMVRYLFTRAAELPELQGLLADAHERATRIGDAAAVWAGLLAGRRRVSGEAQRRAWRQELERALAIGDKETAARLQQLLLQRLRDDRPRPASNRPPAAATGSPGGTAANVRAAGPPAAPAPPPQPAASDGEPPPFAADHDPESPRTDHHSA
ncbi:MAG: DNA primase [Planctomycetes bacterium]|nr:DNA primase [Planctomycetota bacterium]